MLEDYGCDLPFSMTVSTFPHFFENWHLQGGSRSILWDRLLKVRPAFRKAGRIVLRVASFNTLIRCSGRDLAPNQADLEKVRPAFRWAGRTWGVGLRGSKKCWKMKVLRMTPSIVENVPTPQEILLKLFPASQLSYRAKFKEMPENIYKIKFFRISCIRPRGIYSL